MNMSTNTVEFALPAGNARLKNHASLSIAVTALNEADVVGEVLESIIKVCQDCLDKFEIIAIDDGSTDATGSIMEEFARKHAGVRVIHNRPNKGIGFAYKQGLAEARYEYYMLLCGDGGLPASSLPAIFAKIGSADIVIPYMLNLSRIKTPSRFVLSRTYAKLLNLVSGLRLHYYNGLPVHRVDRLRSVDISSDGFGFQAETLIKLIKSGSSFVEVGVLGAEKTNRSSALRLKNFVSVMGTLSKLLGSLKSAPSRP